MIPITKPYLGEEEVDAAAAAIRSSWVTQGPRVAEFEAEFARVCGTRHAIAVCNCTAALQLALLALGVGPGDEVICPSLSFVATPNSIVNVGVRGPLSCSKRVNESMMLIPIFPQMTEKQQRTVIDALFAVE